MRGWRAKNKDKVRAIYLRSRAKNSDKMKAAGRRYQEANILRWLYHGAKARAKQRGLEFDIELADLIVPKECPVLGTAFVRRTRYAMSIDRVDNTKGYVKGNVIIVSRKVNTIKADATVEELEKVTAFYRARQGEWRG